MKVSNFMCKFVQAPPKMPNLKLGSVKLTKRSKMPSRCLALYNLAHFHHAIRSNVACPSVTGVCTMVGVKYS